MDFSINQFTFLLCHILFVIILVLFFSVLVVWTVHASFRVHFQVVTTAFFCVLLLVFLPGYRLCEALDSHCVTNTSCPSFPESHFYTVSLSLRDSFVAAHWECQVFSILLQFSRKSPARCGWEIVLHKLGVLWQTSDPQSCVPSCTARHSWSLTESGIGLKQKQQ